MGPGRGRLRKAAALAALALCCAAPGAAAQRSAGADTGLRVLVFSKTAAFRHASIPHGINVIKALGAQNGFAVDATEDASQFTDANLARYAAVIWLSTTGDVLNDTQQAAFERYIENGGGWVGIHAAADTEYDWPWYGGLLGAWFRSHPKGVHPATIDVEDRSQPSTSFLPARWRRSDEWYNFQTDPRGAVHVLASLDERSYSGGTMGFDHPIAWCHLYDGGRAWYTAGGHKGSAFDEPLFRRHLLGGILWAAGAAAGNCGATALLGDLDAVIGRAQAQGRLSASQADALLQPVAAAKRAAVAGDRRTAVAKLQRFRQLAADPASDPDGQVRTVLVQVADDLIADLGG